MLHIHNKSKSLLSDKKEQHFNLSNSAGGETHIHIHMDNQQSTQQIEQKLQSLTVITEKLTQSLSFLAGQQIHQPVHQQNQNAQSQEKSNYNDKSVNILDRLPKKRFSSNIDSKLQNATNVKKNGNLSEIRKDEKIKRKRGRPQKQNQSHDDQYCSKDNLLAKVNKGLMTTRSKSKINEKEVELYDQTQDSNQSHGPVNQIHTRTKRKYTRRSESLNKIKTSLEQKAKIESKFFPEWLKEKPQGLMLQSIKDSSSDFISKFTDRGLQDEHGVTELIPEFIYQLATRNTEFSKIKKCHIQTNYEFVDYIRNELRNKINKFQRDSQSRQEVQVEKQDKKSQKLKRPTNAYQYFVQEKMPNVVKDNKINVAEGSKIISKMWSSMTENQKSPYFDKALNERLNYQQKMVSFLKEQEQPKLKVRKPRKVKIDQVQKPKFQNIKHLGKTEMSIQSKLEAILGKRSHESNQSNQRDQNDKISKCQKGRGLTQVSQVNEEIYNALTQDSSVTELFDQNLYTTKNQKIKDEIKTQNSIISSSMEDRKMSIGNSDEASYINLFQK